jgi:hypothetical protein
MGLVALDKRRVAKVSANHDIGVASDSGRVPLDKSEGVVKRHLT